LKHVGSNCSMSIEHTTRVEMKSVSYFIFSSYYISGLVHSHKQIAFSMIIKREYKLNKT